MIIKPKIRGFVCTTAHPLGCKAHVEEQIAHVQSHSTLFQSSPQKPRSVLIIGGSTGYGLASCITAAFGYGATTVSIFLEREPTADSLGSAGWYNRRAFEEAAKKANLFAMGLNGDAFSNAMKQEALANIRRLIDTQVLAPIDLVIYSVASPRRTHPETGHVARSVLKPIGQPFVGKTLDTDKLEIKTVSIEPATETEIADTVQVMGGEDWELWVKALSEAGVLSPDCKTVAYTYIGAQITWPIYGQAAIGKAKEDLDRASRVLNDILSAGQKSGTAHVAVMKAIVTQASSAIPIMPLYISLLYKVMKQHAVHEGAIEQTVRLFAQRLYAPGILGADEQGRIRVDDLELRSDIQKAVEASWANIETHNLLELADVKGYQADFLKLFGFGLPGVNYEEEVSPLL